MTTTINDWRDAIRTRGVGAALGGAAVQAQLQAHAIALKVQELTQHPGWDWFLNEVATLRQTAQGAYESVVRDLTLGDAVGDDLARLKLSAWRYDATLRALDAVTALVPRALAQGRDAS